MSERTDDLTRERETEAVDEVGVGDVDVDDGVGDVGVGDDSDTEFAEFGTDATTSAETTTDTDTDAATGGIRGRVDDAFSVTSFAIQLGGALAGAFLLGGALPLGPLSAVVGILAALFGLGLLSTGPRYAEAGLSGALVGVVTTVLTSITLSVVSGGLVPVAGGVAGGLAALVGHYFGRDLRDGLTRDL
jgi:hypothetical protein